MSNNIKDYNNQNNEAIDNEPTLHNSGFSLSRGNSDPLPVVTVSPQGGNKHRATIVAGLTCLWYSGATDSMIKRQHMKHYERKMRSKRVEYSTASCVYFSNHDVKVTFGMTEFSDSKIINHHFHVDNDEGELVIGYYMIIGWDLMVKLGLTADFKRQVLQWDGTTVHMKESRNLLGKSDLTKREMRKVVMKTAEPASTREDTEIMVKILDSTYAKAELKHVVNDSQLNDEKRNLLLILLEDFEDLFD